MEARGFVDALGGFVADLFAPLTQALADPDLFGALLHDLGWQPLDVDADLNQVSAHLGFIQPLNRLVELTATVRQAAKPDPADVAELAQKVIEAVTKLTEVAARPVPPSLPPPLSDPQFWAHFGDELLGLLVARYLSRYRPVVYAALYLLGLIEEQENTAETGPAGARPVLRWDRLPALLGDPVAVMTEVYGWDSAFEHVRLIRALEETLSAAGLAAWRVPAAEDRVARHYGATTPAPDRLAELRVPFALGEDPPGGGAVSAEAGLLILPIPAVPGGAPAGLLITPYATGQLGAEIAVSDTVVLRIEGTADATGSTGVRLLPGAVSGFADTGALAGGLQFEVAYQPEKPLTLVGGTDGTRATVDAVSLALALAGSSAQAELRLELGLTGLEAKLDFGEGDGFVGALIGSAADSTVRLECVLIWSNRRGLTFRGGGGLRLNLPLHQQLGPVQVHGIEISIEAGTSDQTAAVSILSAVTFDAVIGPFTASVERIGARLDLVEATNGPLAGLAPRLAFEPPDGAGLLLDTAVVRGGGYALFDEAAEQYAGILQLSIQDVLSVTAIGLIATRMPDASKGFSLLIILTAEFPPIQLGFGFTLSGLGGILGLNRTMAVDVLRAGARTGALDSVLFPRNPLADVMKVISDVQGVFPVAPGRFVIGLMARLGWGSPQIITVDLGIVVELPAPLRITLLGRFSLVLPKPDDAVVELHLDVVGIIDVGRGEISLDATLHDSRLAMFAISGDMAARIGWGANPMFAISAGGLNPRFEPPPGFPELRRLAITLATSDNPRVRMESYLATTSNSVQIGARLDVYAELDAGLFGLFSASAYLGFDALVILDPFGFVVVIYGGADIKRNGRSILSADIFLSLSGPEPWHAWGYAEVNFLGRHRIPADITLGEEPAAVAPPATDPLADLQAAVADERNWIAQLPSGDAGGVTLRQLGSDEHDGKVLAHPLGRLTVRQRVVPLALTIMAYAGAPAPANASRFDLKFSVDGTPADESRAEVRDGFAPGQFFDLSEDEKLSRPAFEQLVCGYAGIGSAAVTFGTAVAGSDDYETLVIDVADPAPRPVPGGYQVPDNMLDVLAQTGAAGRTVARPRYDGPSSGLALADPAYRLASTVDLSATGGQFASRVEADEALRSAGSGLQVVGSHEVT